MKVYAIWEGEYEEAYPVLFATRELAVEYVAPSIREHFRSLCDPAFWQKPHPYREYAETQAAFWRAKDEAEYVAAQCAVSIHEMEVREAVMVPA